MSKESNGNLATLICDPGNSFTNVQVYDGNLNPVVMPHHLGSVELKLPVGAYKVIFTAGNNSEERIVYLPTSGARETVALAEPLPITTSAPVFRSETSHEYQNYGAQEISKLEALDRYRENGGAHLMVLVREVEESRRGNPATGLELLQEKENPDENERWTRLFDFADEGDYRAQQNFVGAHINLDPGAYLLQLQVRRELLLRQMLYLTPGWQTQVFFNTRDDKQNNQAFRRVDMTSMSVLLARPGDGFDPDSYDTLLTTKALNALIYGTPLPAAEVAKMWGGKFQNPMLGLYGAHLHLQGAEINFDLMTQVFENLYEMIGPHPDVLAIGWGTLLKAREIDETSRSLTFLQERLQNYGPIDTPPMLQHSWQMIVAASRVTPGLIPLDSLSSQISLTAVDSAPWLNWTGNPRRPLRSGSESRSKLLNEREAANPNRYASFNTLETTQLEALGRAKGLSGLDTDIQAEIDSVLDEIEQLLQQDDRVIDKIFTVDELDWRDDNALTDMELSLLLLAFPDLESRGYTTYTRKKSSYRRKSVTKRRRAAELLPRLSLPAVSVLESLLQLLEKLRA